MSSIHRFVTARRNRHRPKTATDADDPTGGPCSTRLSGQMRQEPGYGPWQCPPPHSCRSGPIPGTDRKPVRSAPRRGGDAAGSDRRTSSVRRIERRGRRKQEQGTAAFGATATGPVTPRLIRVAALRCDRRTAARVLLKTVEDQHEWIADRCDEHVPINDHGFRGQRTQAVDVHIRLDAKHLIHHQVDQRQPREEMSPANALWDARCWGSDAGL